jgi:glucose-6-phosphate isomerase
METGLVFRILRSWLKQHHPEGIQDRVVAITSKDSGSLRKLTDEAGYQSFEVPDSMGGDFPCFHPLDCFR